jgi:hypothetical protein
LQKAQLKECWIVQRRRRCYVAPSGEAKLRNQVRSQAQLGNEISMQAPERRLKPAATFLSWPQVQLDNERKYPLLTTNN